VNEMTREFDTIIVKDITSIMDTIGMYRSFYPNGIVKAGKTNGIFWVKVEVLEDL